MKRKRVSLWRAQHADPFTAAEEKLLLDLSQPIAEASRRTALLSTERSKTTHDAPGMLIFDEHGVLQSLNDQAEAFLRDLPPTTTSRARGEYALPTEILTVAAQARAIEAGYATGVARARLQDHAGRWLVIHGFCLRGASNWQGSTALVIEPAKASAVAPIIIEAYQFTAREQQNHAADRQGPVHERDRRQPPSVPAHRTRLRQADLREGRSRKPWRARRQDLRRALHPTRTPHRRTHWLTTAGFGFGKPGSKPGTKYEYAAVAARTPTDPGVNTISIA